MSAGWPSRLIGSVATSGGGTTVTVSPDGSIAYTVVPESDTVIPIGVDSLVTYPSIGVGDNPVSIAMHPYGTEAYVANFGSASLSVIGRGQGDRRIARRRFTGPERREDGLADHH